MEYCGSWGFAARYRQLQILINEVGADVHADAGADYGDGDEWESHNDNDEKCKKAAPVAEVKGRVGRRGAFELLVNGQMVRVSFLTWQSWSPW